MKQFFQDVKNSFLLSAAVSIILGIVLIVYPVKTSLLICYIAGALLLFGGVVALIASRGEPFFFRYDLFVALVLILFGCFVIFESDLVIAFIPVVIGIILLANGLLSIQKAFNLKKTGLEKWWLEFLLALLTIIICTNPFDAVATTNIFIGICLVYSGISDLVTTYYMGRAKRRIKNVIQTEINQQKILHDDNVIDVDEDELH